MKAKRILPVLLVCLAAACLTSCTFNREPDIEIPVRIDEGQLLSVPFFVTWEGAHDLELEFVLNNAAERFTIVHSNILSNVIGTATISCEGKTLSQTLPTGWVRGASGRSNLIGTVIVRFWAEGNKAYLLSLAIKSLPKELKSVPAMIRLVKVTPHFHPGHPVHQLQ